MIRQVGYREVAEDYRRRIASGELRAGSRLPTISDRADEYRVSRTTMQRANGMLRDEGFFRVTPGGTYVAESRAKLLWPKLAEVLNELESAGQDPQFKVGPQSCILGVDGAVTWDPEREEWKVTEG